MSTHLVTEAEAKPGHTVRLLPALLSTDEVPAELALPTRIGRAARAGAGVALTLATICGLVFIVGLWTDMFGAEPIPGAWFSAIFTVLIGVVVVGFWAGFGYAKQSRRLESTAQDDWVALRDTMTAAPGRITERVVQLGDRGEVLGFTLVIAHGAGARDIARWRELPQHNSLLQPQVPAVGAEVRIWTPAHLNSRPGAQILLVDAVDPTSPRSG